MEAATTDLNAASLILATVAVLVAIMGSTLTMVIMMYRLYGRLDTKIDNRFDRLDTKFDTKIDRLDTRVTGLETRFTGLETRFTGLETRFDGLETRFTGLETRFDGLEGKLDAMGHDVADTRERVARIEGYLLASEGFTPGTSQPPVAVDPPPEDPSAGKRQAG